MALSTVAVWIKEVSLGFKLGGRGVSRSERGVSRSEEADLLPAWLLGCSVVLAQTTCTM